MRRVLPRFGANLSGSGANDVCMRKTEKSPANATPKKVLIVEDNDLNMKLFNDLLEAHGYEHAADQGRYRGAADSRANIGPI